MGFSKWGRRLFLLGGLLAYFAAAYILLNRLGISCVFLEIFGVPCPGCGMTRALFSLLRLDFISAARYNVAVFFMPYIALYIFFDFKHKIHRMILLGIGAIFVLNWIFKLTILF